MSLFVSSLWFCGAVPMGEGGKVFQKSWFLNLTSPQTVGIVLSVSVIGAVVARFVHTEEVTGSNPVSRTRHPRLYIHNGGFCIQPQSLSADQEGTR